MTKFPNSHLMTTVELANVLDAEFRKYNARRHRGTKAIPLETLRAHPTEPRRVDEKHIALALLRRTKGTIQKDGVEFNGIMYQGPGTFAHIDEEIIRGSLVTRPDFLHVFDPNHGGDEVWLGRLTPAAGAGLVFVATLAAYVLGRQVLFPLRSIPRITAHGRTITLLVAALALAVSVGAPLLR